jgi:hypothetical protein
MHAEYLQSIFSKAENHSPIASQSNRKPNHERGNQAQAQEQQAGKAKPPTPTAAEPVLIGPAGRRWQRRLLWPCAIQALAAV